MLRKQVPIESARPRRRAVLTPIVSVITLGGFSIRVHGEPLALGRKTPAKPLALLKLLAAQGPHAIADAQVADALWPDKASSAPSCLAVNLHRLRRLLGATEVLVHRDRQVAIDSRWVWCDAIACEKLLDQAARCAQDAQRMQLVRRALALYGGDFLAGEPGAGWIGSARARLRARYVRACAALAERLAAEGRWEQALSFYQRGVDADELAENLCLGLMACCGAMHRPLAGRDAYQRFARALAAHSGAQPAPAMRALYAQLSRQRPVRNAARAGSA